MRSSLRLAAARVHSAGNLGWSVGALTIALFAAAPLIAIAVLGLRWQ